MTVYIVRNYPYSALSGVRRPLGVIERINKRLTAPLANRLKDKHYVTPNRITWASFIVAGILSPLMIVKGYFFISAILILIGAWLDSLDGDLARIRNQKSKEGAILDAVLDRYADLLVIASIIMVVREFHDALIVGLFAMLGSFLVPFVRAETESLGKSSVTTFGSRDIRNIMLVIGLGLGELYALLWALALTTNLSALHRLYHLVTKIEKANIFKEILRSCFPIGIITPIMIIEKYFFVAAILILLAVMLGGKAGSKEAEALNSILWRFADSLILISILIVLISDYSNSLLSLLIGLAAIIGLFLMSYVRVRVKAEKGISVDFMPRIIFYLIIALGLILAQLNLTLLFISILLVSILTNLSASCEFYSAIRR